MIDCALLLKCIRNRKIFCCLIAKNRSHSYLFMANHQISQVYAERTRLANVMPYASTWNVKEIYDHNISAEKWKHIVFHSYLVCVCVCRGKCVDFLGHTFNTRFYYYYQHLKEVGCNLKYRITKRESVFLHVWRGGWGCVCEVAYPVQNHTHNPVVTTAGYFSQLHCCI